MSRLEIAKERIEFNFSDQEYLKRRTKSISHKLDGRAGGYSRMTTVLMEQPDMPKGRLIHEYQM